MMFRCQVPAIKSTGQGLHVVGKEVPILLDIRSSGEPWESHCFLWVSLGKETELYSLQHRSLKKLCSLPLN